MTQVQFDLIENRARTTRLHHICGPCEDTGGKWVHEAAVEQLITDNQDLLDEVRRLRAKEIP